MAATFGIKREVAQIVIAIEMLRADDKVLEAMLECIPGAEGRNFEIGGTGFMDSEATTINTVSEFYAGWPKRNWL